MRFLTKESFVFLICQIFYDEVYRDIYLPNSFRNCSSCIFRNVWFCLNMHSLTAKFLFQCINLFLLLSSILIYNFIADNRNLFYFLRQI